MFQKLLLNFTWWLNRQDPDGNNVFGGGFLGLDNISPIDRSHLPPGVQIEQADGTAWMAYYSLAMLVLAVALAERNNVYEDMVIKFLEQFVLIVDAIGESGLYDAADGFFYDRLRIGGGAASPSGCRRWWGPSRSLPRPPSACADSARIARLRKRFARLAEPPIGPEATTWRLDSARTATNACVRVGRVPRPARPRRSAPSSPRTRSCRPTGCGRCRGATRRPTSCPGMPGATIAYEPAESRTAMYGGNSNWRGPVWFPVNYLVIRALLQYDQFLGDDFTVEYPTGSGVELTLAEVAGDLTDRLRRSGCPAPTAAGPCYGGVEMLQTDPAWRDNLLFFEYFHGDDGAGLGAMHQTGWTALVVDLLLDRPGAPARRPPPRPDRLAAGPRRLRVPAPATRTPAAGQEGVDLACSAAPTTGPGPGPASRGGGIVRRTIVGFALGAVAVAGAVTASGAVGAGAGRSPDPAAVQHSELVGRSVLPAATYRPGSAPSGVLHRDDRADRRPLPGPAGAGVLGRAPQRATAATW